MSVYYELGMKPIAITRQSFAQDIPEAATMTCSGSNDNDLCIPGSSCYMTHRFLPGLQDPLNTCVY